MMPVGVHCNFPGGNVAGVRFVDGAHIEFEAPVDESPWSLWYYFCVTGCAGRRLTLTQVGMSPVLGLRESRGYAPVCPVYTRGGRWERVDERAIRYDEAAMRFEFELDAADDEVFVAFCYPYLLDDFERFIERQPRALWRRVVLGRSAEGREYPIYLIGNPDDPAVTNMVVLSARTHAGETPGSFVLEGALEAVLGGSELGRRALENTLFAVVPVVDLDSVQEGRYGKDRYPRDFNRDWRVKPCHPEIELVQRELEQLAARYTPVFALDLHAPQPGGSSYFPPNREAETGSDIWNAEWIFVQAYEDACAGRFPFRLADVDRNVLDWGGLESPALMRQDLYARFGIPALTMEYSYHRSEQDVLLQPDDWRLAGRLLMETLASHRLIENRLRGDADRARVPDWTIPPAWTDWNIVRMPNRVDVSERTDGLLSVRPLAARNGAFLISRADFDARSAREVLKVSVDAPAAMQLCCAYYDEAGRFLRNGRPQFAWLQPGENSWRYAPCQIEAARFRVSVRFDDLPCEVRLSIRR